MRYHVYDFEKFSEEIHSFNFNTKLTLSYCGSNLFYRPQMKEIKNIKSFPVNLCDYFLIPITFHINNPFDNYEDNKWDQVFNEMKPFVKEILLKCNFFNDKKNKHVVFQTGDCDRVLPELQECLVFKESPCKNLPIFPFYYQTKINEGLFTKSILETKYDVSFQGTTNNNSIRKKIKPLLFECEKNKLKVYYKDSVKYFYFLCDAEQKKMKFEMFNLINESKFIINPKGKGHSSPRFFETLQLGRIPLILSDNLKLPLPHVIPWKKICIRIPEEKCLNTHDYIFDFMAKNNLFDTSETIKEIWNKYFSPNCLNNFLDKSLQKEIKCL